MTKSCDLHFLKKQRNLISTKKGSSIMLWLQDTRQDRRAKDGEFEMSLGLSRTMVGVERVAGSRAACSQSLAVAGLVGGHVVRQRSAYRDDLASCGGRQRRLPRLLSLPHLCGTQEQIDRHAVGDTSFADFAFASACVVGDRRLAHQAVWAKGRRGRRAPQPDAGTSRFCRDTLG